MISYQWDVQKLVIQIKNKLQADGYKVWMDIDEMGGSTLESMARAVENASVVLVCVSQKYKESPNCRSGNSYQPYFWALMTCVPRKRQRQLQCELLRREVTIKDHFRFVNINRNTSSYEPDQLGWLADFRDLASSLFP